MAYSESVAKNIRKSLAQVADVEEKKMFGGLAFMVNGKMCLTAGAGRMMVRIDPAIHDKEIKRKGCETVVMVGRQYKGYIHVDEDVLKSSRDFERWVQLALEFNETLT